MPRKKVRREVYPGMVTSLNLLSGLGSIVLSLNGEFLGAGLLLVVCVILDACDGRLARAMHATSDFGSELDTLTDIACFGIAPFIFALSQFEMNIGLILAGMLFVQCGVFRLVRYSVSDSKLPGFRGMPITCNGVIFFVLYLLGAQTAVVIAAFVILGLLMVSTIRVPRIF